MSMDDRFDNAIMDDMSMCHCTQQGEGEGRREETLGNIVTSQRS